MPSGQDYLSHIQLNTADSIVILTVYFTGGPITGFVTLDSEQKPFSFAADPFFRKQDNYVTSGSVFIPISFGPVNPRGLSVLFTNASGVPAQHRIELSSPKRLDHSEAAPGSDVPARLFTDSGTIPPKESVQYSIVLD